MGLPSPQLRLDDVSQQGEGLEGTAGEDRGHTHWSNESRHHGEEEGEDGHQHAGLAEPPEDSGQGRSFPAVLLQLIVPQLLQPGNTTLTG